MGQAFDVVCIGGGVIGLITADQLAQRGLRVAVLDRGKLASEASWAGAGIITPCSLAAAKNPYDLLRAHSFQEFPQLAERLRDETGVDIGFLRCGGFEVAINPADRQVLVERQSSWRQLQIRHRFVTGAQIRELEPSLSGEVTSGFFFDDLCQIRNPWFLRALITALRRARVALYPETQVTTIVRGQAGRVEGVRLADESILPCQSAIVTSGAWSARLLQTIGFSIPVRPIRGQIAALQTDPGTLRSIVLLGRRYLVPRQDGLVLAGSTEEDVGFDRSNTDVGVADLLALARTLVPSLAQAPVVHQWAGLRPGISLGSPLLGRVPGWENLWIATGHFREGIQLAPGTGKLLADWITGLQGFTSVNSFAIDADRSDHVPPFHS